VEPYDVIRPLRISVALLKPQGSSVLSARLQYKWPVFRYLYLCFYAKSSVNHKQNLITVFPYIAYAIFESTFVRIAIVYI